MSDTVIKAEYLSKYYRLGVINNGTLFRDIQTWIALKRGKEDPHSRIGENKYAGNADGFWALKDLNFEIKQGDRVGIIGKNGAGKSTLLKVLSRITAPTEGNVKIKGRVASLLEVGTGFHAELTGRENIYLNGAILGMKRREVDRKIDEIIAFSEIEQHIDTPVKRYSSGMYVRLAFAVAAHLDSEILIADEVLAVGDASFQKKALGKMNELSTGQGRTVLFVSHQIPAVTALCNKGMFLDKGRIVPTNSLQDCIDLYMSSGMSTDNGFWEGNEGDDTLKLYSVKMNSVDGENRKTFIKGDIVNLFFEYEIFLDRENFVFCIEIFNTKGVQIVACSAGDMMDESQFESLKTKGKHSATLEVDTSIFATGDYLIKFDFAIHNIKRIITDTPTMQFSIINSDENIGQSATSRQGIILPNWSWRI
jgi:lipopolysaccharide transport system ATP-binding protein